ncbi:MAG TPA: TetR/AcrR family transcriptional regulator [Deltaproteobacteria bacterium]|nr:TetR/AcrR family transcriptional regulator [Deltaproteobacteria bacterium]
MQSSLPIRRRTRRPRAEREAEILEAARAVFAEKGYGATAVAEIAARAGVVEGTVYSYFESKRSLLIAVMKNFFEALIAETASGLSAIRGTENQLRFVIRRQLETFTSDLGLCRVIISEARPDIALYDEAILDLNRRYTGLALAVLEEGVENGTLRSDIVPSVIRDLIYGGIEHAVWRSIFTHREIDVEALTNQLSDALLGGIVRESSSRMVDSDPGGEARARDTITRLERAVERLEARLESPSVRTAGDTP